MTSSASLLAGDITASATLISAELALTANHALLENIVTAPFHSKAKTTVIEKCSGIFSGRVDKNGRPYFRLVVSGSPFASGASGAPIFVDDRLVGIVALQKDLDVYAIPVNYMAESTRTPDPRCHGTYGARYLFFGLNHPTAAATSHADNASLQIYLADTVPANVPEPGTLSMLALGLVGLGFMRRRKA